VYCDSDQTRRRAGYLQPVAAAPTHRCNRRHRLPVLTRIEQIIVIAIIQGLTEFLPVSSSGHLALIPVVTDWPDQGVITDVMVHVGSLFAVIAYFWKDVWNLLCGTWDMIRFRNTDNSRMAGYIALATIPALAFGAALKLTGTLDALRADPVTLAKIIAWAAVIYGILLWLADTVGSRLKKMEDMKLAPALIIGFAQALALIPGTSRSGATMTAARFLGFERAEAPLVTRRSPVGKTGGNNVNTVQ